jgi:c-di-GMP-binding flagellar brake protein YcgR
MKTNQDQTRGRESPRSLQERPATLCDLDRQVYHPALLVDLSLTGARLRLAKAVSFPRGASVLLYWTPVAGVPPLELQAQIQRIQAGSEDSQDLGLRFENLSERLQKILSQFVVATRR